MNLKDAKATFLLEYCAERCEGYQNDDACETCEINFAIKAIEKQIPKKPKIIGRRMTELKECPFCGGEAIIQSPNMHRVTCISCKQCKASTAWLPEEEAIEAWNRRAE